jgi:ElaB/YqjD/DUF883 family membrane-anchored ribosome-binding protein
MTESEYLRHSGETVVKRSTEDIRQDIAIGEEKISQTIKQIGERIKEKLDWRGYVKDYPYLALVVAAGLGCIASGIFLTRTTAMERINRPRPGK